jgi:hypothetical protein
MTPGQFLRRVWPSTGLYCIAHPFKPEGSDVTVYAHKIFHTISEAVTHVHEQIDTADTFFAVLSLAQERVWDPTKTDWRTGEKGAWATRLQSNMLASKSAFFDLDVGNDPAKYATQRDALAALISFLDVTGLPMPTLVSSGGGVHVYWHYATDVPTLEWRDLAWQMRQLAEACGLKVDPTRTIDSSSVLRVVGTKNWKDRSNPREVKVLQEGVITAVPAFRQIVSDALIKHGVIAGAAPLKSAIPAVSGLGIQTFTDFGPPPTLGELAAACNQTKEIIRSQGDPSHPFYGQLDNTAWYRGMLATVSHVEDGENWCRKLTDLHPRTNADIEAKLLQLKQFAPARCETLAQYMPWKDTPCQTCRFNNDPSVPNPLAGARKSTPAAQPTVELKPAAPQAGLGTSATPSAPIAATPSAAVQSILIPNPPKPYERLKTGGISITRTDKDGNDSTTVIFAHDLYPVKRLVDAESGVERQIWRATLPRSGTKEFMIEADTLYDGRKFAASISNNGLYPNRADLPALQDYMTAYISQLQRDLDADTQISHLGWGDGYRHFTLPDKTLMEDGSVKATALSEGAKRASQFIGKRGDMASQIALLGWYNHADYIPNQFVILAGLGSIIFYATGNHGVVVNMSGDSGASKSTSLYTMAGLWGDPVLLPINGTNRGATANARASRIGTFANLPTPVDEITHMPAKEVIDLVMNITQPGHRLRLGTDGSEKAVSDNHKSAIMISTANSSLHSVLSTDNAAGTAGSMRVFEMKFSAQRVHTKAEADEFLRQIKEHHGHIGEVFAQFVVRNRVAVEKRVQAVMREIDIEGSVGASERFWSATIAVVLVAGEICKALGLAPYDVAALREWAIKVQIPFMRGVVKEEYRDPLAVMTDYIAEKHGSIVVVDKAATTIGTNTAGAHVAVNDSYAVNSPHGALLGHYDTKAQVLYLLKQGFKDHCNRVGASSSRILDELSVPRTLPNQGPRRIVTDRAIRRTLGAGTSLAKGQSWCFAIDMSHPEMTGAVPIVVATGGVPTSAPAGKLQAVT